MVSPSSCREQKTTTSIIKGSKHRALSKGTISGDEGKGLLASSQSLFVCHLSQELKVLLVAREEGVSCEHLETWRYLTMFKYLICYHLPPYTEISQTKYCCHQQHTSNNVIPEGRGLPYLQVFFWYCINRISSCLVATLTTQHNKGGLTEEDNKSPQLSTSSRQVLKV